ncbi:RNaseH domain-containing protein [Streptomyces sp. NPDC057094]
MARLCHQALSWCDRTRYPAPLHAALQMDLDHLGLTVVARLRI